MNIWYFCMDAISRSSNNVTAPSIHIRETVRALRGQGHRVHQYLYGDSVSEIEGTLRHTSQKISQKNLLYRSFEPLMRDIYGLYRNTQDLRLVAPIFRDNRIDLIYERLTQNNSTVSVCTQRYDIPLMVESNAPVEDRREYWGAPLFFLTKRLEKTILKRADAVTVVSTPIKKYYERMGIEAQKIHVLPNGVNQELFSQENVSLDVRAELGLEEKVIVGFVGNIFVYHGIELFLILARNCLSSGYNIHFMIVGGDQVGGQGINQLHPLLNREQLNNMFTFTGPIPNTEVPNYIAAMDICILPRFMWYGSPMKIFEYAAMGKPIIAPDQENIRDVLTHGETALLVKSENPTSIVQAVKELVRDEQLRIELGQAARKHILSTHTWNKNALRIQEIYQQIT